MRIKNSEQGFTLVEMMVVLVVLAVVLSVMYKGFDTLQASTTRSQERIVNLDESRVVMAQITKDMRAAASLAPGEAPFVLADAREMIFYSNIGNTAGPSRIRIYVDADNRLIEEVIAPGGTAPNYTYTGTPTIRAVGSYITPSVQLFTYQYFNEATSSFVTLSSLPLSSTDRIRVESVEVMLPVRKSATSGTPATTLINRVRLTNVYYNPATS